MTAPRPAPAQPWVLHRSPDAASQTQALAQDLTGRLNAAVQQRGLALLAVSGGRSPVALFQALRQQAVDWARVTVILVDERCVQPDHPDSNTALVRQHLLQDGAQAARFVPFFDQLPDGCLHPQGLHALTAQAQARLATLPWPLDVALLGMGEDGHTASLFPGAEGLEQALTSTQAVAWTRPSTAPHARLTLTLPTLRAARTLVLPLQGAGKAQVFASACAGPTPALPVSLLLHGAARPVQVWQTL